MSTIRLPRGRELERTCSEIIDTVRRSLTDARVHWAARSICANAGRGPDRLARCLDRWGRHVWQFVPDPVDTDAIAEPGDLLDRWLFSGGVAGDCDDAAAVMASLARSVGLPARLVTVAWYPELVHSHVWADAFVTVGANMAPDGGDVGYWYDMDVTGPSRRSRRPPISEMLVWPV